MSESSESRPDEDHPITHYHQREFEIRRLKMSGDDFQQLFEDIMVRARPGFIRVRPYGNIGDRKCDGLFRNDSIFFQVYSPDELDQAKVQKKIDEDLNGAVAHWGDALKTWVFVYNVRRGLAPDIPGTLREKQKQYPNIKIDHLSNDDLWEITRGLSIEQRNEILGLPPSSPVKTKQTSAFLSNAQEHGTNWQDICRGMLPIELDANPLISGDGVTLGIEDVVPLDLVEQKERPKPTRDRSPENYQQVLEDQEIPLPYNQFFDHVLTECRSLNQQGKGIAIIGEPGAGKTTLLCAIADWIMKRGELPVFVSLQDLEAGLESYLLEVWLKDAIRKREVLAPLQDHLIEQCNAGRVWLLLDGVDEMAQAQQSLSKLAKEFRGWVGDARIVLTCRVNVWDANRNELRSKFEVYRSRGFSNEDQLTFIENFFARAKQPETGTKLIEKLASAPARLKDLIKSPLWITLLCRTWKRQEGKLPATKAELYEGFTKTFYDWKDKPYVPEEKRPLLERALEELAKRAIDQEDFRFRLREKFIRQELDKFDSSFFRIACELGWINKLGNAVENPDEAVYAFLHPTFQEYFAALAIDDYHFFLNHVPHNLGEGVYRIFESQWREVFLLWLGRENILKKDKDSIIEALIRFDDACSGLYQYRTYCLAASGISEFVECSIKVSILEQVVTWHFGYFSFNLENKKWILFLNPNPIDDLVELTLRETDRATLIDAIIALIVKNFNNSICRDAARSLGRFGYNNREAIQALLGLVRNNSAKQVRQQAVESLGEIGSKVPEVIDELNYHLVNAQDNEEKLQIAKSLGKLDPGNSNAIKVLIEALLSNEDGFASKQISWVLRGIDINKIAVEDIVKLLSISQDERERQFLNERLAYIDPGNPSQATSGLRRILDSDCDDITKFKAAINLIEIDSKNFDAISTLISLLKNTQNIEIKKQIIGSLGMLITDSLAAIDALTDLLYLEQDETILILASEMLRWVGSGNESAILALTRLIQTSQNSELQYHYAECLGDIDPGNSEAIITFIKLLDIRNDDEHKIYAIDRLSSMRGLENSIVKNKLFNLLDNDQSRCVCLESAWHLWFYSACNINVIYDLLIDQLFSGRDEKICSLAAWRLKSILQDKLFHKTVVQLEKNLPITACKEKLNIHKIYFNLALFCVQKMFYLDFYRAWHSSSSADAESLIRDGEIKL